MKRFLLLPMMLLSLALAGCGTTSVFQGGTSVTATVANPVSMKDLYLVENAYAAAVRSALEYRRLRQCRKSEVESLTNVCARRSVLVRLQDYNAQARRVRTALYSFVHDNPRLSALSALGAFRNAVADFQTELTISGVK